MIEKKHEEGAPANLFHNSSTSVEHTTTLSVRRFLFYLGSENDGYSFGYPQKIYMGIYVDTQNFSIRSNVVSSVRT